MADPAGGSHAASHPDDEAPADPHAYDYDRAPAGGTSAAPLAEVAERRPEAQAGGSYPEADPSSSDADALPRDPADPPTSEFGPAAQLRPVPGGAPAEGGGRRAYRPSIAAAQLSADTGAGHGRRRLWIGLGAGLLALLLAAAVALALWRPWDGDSSPAASGTSAASKPAGVEAGKGVHVSLVGVEEGLDGVGPADHRVTPKGEFAVVTLHIRNDSDASVSWKRSASLVGEDGTRYEPDEKATAALGVANTYIDPGEEMDLKVAVDVPFGSKISTVHVSLPTGTADLPVR